MEFKLLHKVGFSDLDHNGHMNNTNYANLILNAVQNKTFTHFEINFLNECLQDDEIYISVTEDDGEYVIGKVGDRTAFIAYIQ